MQIMKIAGLLVGGLLIAGCAREVGTFENPNVGFTTKTNARVQTAYGDLEQRRRDLSIAFRAAAPDTVTFDFNRSTLKPEARRALDQQAAWLMANEGTLMAVVGHTDLVGSESYNNRLGLRRAQRVVNYLIAKGVDRDRLEAVESRGESEPVVDTQEREERNRRTVTVVAGFDRIYVGTGLPGVIANRLYREYLANGFVEGGDAEE
ncbi:MAG: OmpA family protein [Pseudomonadota bacterium]